METLSAALQRLARAGYTDDFHARDGRLGCAGCDEVVSPADVVIDEVVRFEGASDPDDEAIVFALSSGPCGGRGTYTVAFGPDTPVEDVAVIQALQDGRGH